MPRSFPQHFDLRQFDGPRAKQFAKPEDAFQQLIGDALKEMTGPYVHISPTLGADGSIDSYLIEGAVLTGPLQDLPLPLIIECKAHDDGAKNPRKNIFDQWGKVRSKLEAVAHAGWQDLFQPWSSARGYVYCISAILQNEKNRTDLDEAIRKFFTDLPVSKRPPIESIRVVDWNDLRQWLGTLPVVSDEWLGIELDLVLDHATYLRRLSGFREYLLPSKLPFVPPAEDLPFHPARILSELEKSDERRGLLLVGAGGVGKTRTAIEVGTLAANKGWRVLHVLPDEPGVETEDIAKVVLQYRDSRTLLVFDYIDQMQKLDLGSIRRSLIPAAQEGGIQLRLLANCRPAWIDSSNPERDEMFRVTDLRPSELHKALLIETMADTIAPTACRMIGRNEVIWLCGSRAIIALLIARELESRAGADLLKDINVSRFRSGDLVQWLRRRLQENSLTVKRDLGSLLPARPEEPMVAAAAALACAPENQNKLVAAAESAYEDLHWHNANEDARFLVQMLIKLGWLESHGISISTAHDVVADEVLDQTIHSGALVFETETTAVLSCTLRIPNALGRMATALRRVIGAVKNEDEAQSIGEFLHRWLTSHAVVLGRILEAGDPDLTGYALGAVLSGAPWDETAIEEWDSLALPWLNAHSTKEEARHLLYKGLRNDRVNQAALVGPALSWLDVCNLSLFASFVVGPLLGRSDLSDDESKRATRFAVFWLEQHHSTLEAGFVLPPLLWRGDLPDDESAQTIRFAILWLEQHHSTLEAGFVLKPLLERSDLSDEESKQATRFAILWLEQHHSTPEAQFVLKPLLERSDLSDEESKQATRLAILWLEQHHGTLEAQFVLKPLLERSDLSDDESEQARRFAILWLEQHHSTPDARFVLGPLLERSDLPDEESEHARRLAILWLRQHHGILGAGFVLKGLLECGDLTAEDSEKAGHFALLWLESHYSILDAAFVIDPLFSLPLDIADAKILIENSISWLQSFYDTSEAEFVFHELFRRGDVPVEARSGLLSAAIQRLRQQLADDEATFLLRSCLQYRIEDEELQRELVSLATEWLELHPNNQAGDYVWNRVLRYRRDLVSDIDWLKVARHGLLWLKSKKVNDTGVDQTTNSLLMRSYLLETSEREYVIRLALQLLSMDIHEQGRWRMIARLERLLPSLSDDDPLILEVEIALGLSSESDTAKPDDPNPESL